MASCKEIPYDNNYCLGNHRPLPVPASKSTCKFPPKMILPYFVKLVLANQVESKDSVAYAAAAARNETIKQGATSSADKLKKGDVQEGGSEDNGSQSDESEQWSGSGAPVTLSVVHSPVVGVEGPKVQTSGDGFVVTQSEQRRLSRTFSRKTRTDDLIDLTVRLPTAIMKTHLALRNSGLTRLGPGTYDPDKYHKWIDQKCGCRSGKGGMMSCTPRFPSERKSEPSPAPGVYGQAYDVWEKALERLKHPGKVPFFESSGRNSCREKNVAGSGLPPGIYDTKDSVTELLKKVVSKRGPYDLYTPEIGLIHHGYYKSPAVNPNLGPGTYNTTKTFEEEWESNGKIYKGVFGEGSGISGVRMDLVKPLWPTRISLLGSPGPAHYSLKEPTIIRRGKHPFSSSTKTARPEISEGSDACIIGPGSYSPEKQEYCSIGCGHKSLFKSNTNRLLGYTKMAELSERLRPKDIPLEERIAWNAR